MPSPHIPLSHGTVPRCPLCGILLDVSIDIETRADTKQALLTLAPRSRDHVTSPHTMDYPPEVDL